ncbi:unnamed protein product, partial [Prorocentrum cordatum]
TQQMIAQKKLRRAPSRPRKVFDAIKVAKCIRCNWQVGAALPEPTARPVLLRDGRVDLQLRAAVGDEVLVAGGQGDVGP